MNTKTSQELHWTKECKSCSVQEYCVKSQRYKTISDYGNPSKIRMQRKMETSEAQEIYKLRSKQPNCHLQT